MHDFVVYFNFVIVLGIDLKLFMGFMWLEDNLFLNKLSYLFSSFLLINPLTTLSKSTPVAVLSI